MATLASLEARVSPLTSPPPTESPYQPNRQQSPGEPLEESDSTLVGDRLSLDTIPTRPLSPPDNVHPGHRPSLPATKFNTEGPQPVGNRGSLLALRRRVTGDQTEQMPGWNTDHWDSTSSSSDDEEDENSEDHGGHALGGGRGHLTQIERMPSVQRTQTYNRLHVGNKHFQSKAKVSKTDGRLKISVNDMARTGYLANALGATIQHHLKPQHKDEDKFKEPESPGKFADLDPPVLNILIAIIGSRGDIQPFIKVARILKDDYGHRVRFATHPVFKDFVEKECGLEFFSLGGDPSELMAFMVKNPGLIPSMDTVKKGEIGRRRRQMFEMFGGFWRACINATDDEKDVANLKMMGNRYPFVADAIIANPPSFAHYHCAERLAIPLHLMFTFPYSPTQAFPHPLANIKQSNVDQAYTNFMSYPLVDLMTWQGLGDLVNRFRNRTLGLEEMSTLWAPGQLSRMKVPYTYLWSPGLVPKPEDWGPEISIAGYTFLDLDSSYEPPAGLTKFLKGGPAIYIGFGSISGIDDPGAFTNMIFEAVNVAGVRALVSKGWGGVGGENAPDNIYMLDNIPHDWLFPQVEAVVHHGGAGTTAAGLKCGKPTLIVPFFGDQPFWANMVAKSGAGASQPIPYKHLTAEKLAEGIKECLTPEAKRKAQEIAESIKKEGDGAQNAVVSFHRSLPLTGDNAMRCAIFNDRVAVWHVRKTNIKISALAADLLIEMKRFRWQDLELLRQIDWTDFHGPGEPITGASGALFSSFAETIGGVSKIPFQTRKAMKRREKMRTRRQRKMNRKGAALLEAVSQEKINQKLPNGEHIKDLSKDLSRDGEPKIPYKDDQGMQTLRDLNPVTSLTESEAPAPASATMTIAKATASGIGHSAKALINLPVDFTYALTRGFHNAPRLYGDSSVRQSHTIDGMKSGLRAAREELQDGVADGVTGLVTLPYHDTKRDGTIGVATGTAKGFGGLILKPLTGLLGVPAYLGKGLQVEIHKLGKDTGKTERWIRRARMVQGSLDLKECLAGEKKKEEVAGRPSSTASNVRRDAALRWEDLQEHLKARDEAGSKTRKSLSSMSASKSRTHNHNNEKQ